MRHVEVAWDRLRQSRRATAGLVLLGLVALPGIFAELCASSAPLVAWDATTFTVLPTLSGAPVPESPSVALHAPVRFGPEESSPAGPLAAPSRDHPLGTDAKGRDLFARLVYGARTALGLSLFAVALGIVLGAILGGLAGFFRGFWNERLVRLVETVETFPAIVVVALVRAIEREPSPLSLVVAVALVRWAEVARLVREEVLRASVEGYVLGARALGASPLRILTRHIAPNAVGPLLVSSVFGVASVVLLETAVSFLGMGGEVAAASWGETLAEGARNPAALSLIVLPGMLLAVVLIGSYLVADALRDALDPKAVRQRPEQLGDGSPLSILREPPRT